MGDRYYMVRFDVARQGGLVLRFHGGGECGPHFEDNWHIIERTPCFDGEYKAIKYGELESGIQKLLAGSYEDGKQAGHNAFKEWRLALKNGSQ